MLPSVSFPIKMNYYYISMRCFIDLSFVLLSHLNLVPRFLVERKDMGASEKLNL